VAGIIGARGRVMGVAPGATLRAYKVFGCAGGTGADVILAAMERALATESARPFAVPIARALLARPPPSPQMDRMLRTLDAHPRCGVRAAALRLRHVTATDAPSRESVKTAAHAALRSPCWRLQATALDVLAHTGGTPDPGALLPSFLVRRPASR